MGCGRVLSKSKYVLWMFLPAHGAVLDVLFSGELVRPQSTRSCEMVYSPAKWAADDQKYNYSPCSNCGWCHHLYIYLTFFGFLLTLLLVISVKWVSPVIHNVKRKKNSFQKDYYSLIFCSVERPLFMNNKAMVRTVPFISSDTQYRKQKKCCLKSPSKNFKAFNDATKKLKYFLLWYTFMEIFH